ncbi:transposase-like protein [Sporomusaceae bacterium BoRhaA]|uniref:helix-turn-helix domain-containing protein n=1 Tax=Pelorhabdus rhamnosifermentans TaxID=2772457 RepID=UPI001C06368A|nr:helix-turn-helix domain-containing protein [Pelorhabdus rhamnosifermentans]MBU2700585.1 transposase-like protein [Pelorhabdus rhamnosifermentans]
MPNKGKLAVEEKVRLIESYLSGKIGGIEASRQAGVDYKTIARWVSRYRTEGPTGFLPQEHDRAYSKETKLSAVLDYLSGQGFPAENMRGI